MQNKRYDSVERQVVPAVTGINNLVIENLENTTVNYHGIRYKGRIMFDTLDSTFEFGSGWVSLLCVPPGVSIPEIDSAADAENFQQFVIATEQFAGAAGSTITSGFNTVADFDIVVKTSRNCMKGARLIGQLANDSAGISVILTCTLSCFETTN